MGGLSSLCWVLDYHRERSYTIVIQDASSTLAGYTKEIMNTLVLDSVTYISTHTKDILKMHCGSVCNASLFVELEQMCKDYVLDKARKQEALIEQAKSNSCGSDILIWRIQHYYTYSQLKSSPKMRFTKKEYDDGMSRLNELEQNKVNHWLETNGGYDKYIFQQWGNAE